jgi:hypothetical protein
MASRFLFNESLWAELAERIPKAKSVRAAVAYLGSNASELLPLKEGDQLVVDMSLRAVRSGTTDPREVEKFLERGVEVFSRSTLHAKFFILDRVVIAGSANISQNARESLDEAAILTDDAATVRRALATFEQLCTEPVRKEYLEKCIEEFEPPKFARGTSKTSKSAKVVEAKVWIIGGLTYRDLPEDEREAAEKSTAKYSVKLRDFEQCKVDYCHFPNEQELHSQVREGDWLIFCMEDKRGYDVSPPSRFLGIESHPRGEGKLRFLMLHETLTTAKKIRWSQLRHHLPKSALKGDGATPRTRPVTSIEDADAVLRLWDFRGRFKPVA